MKVSEHGVEKVFLFLFYAFRRKQHERKEKLLHNTFLVPRRNWKYCKLTLKWPIYIGDKRKASMCLKYKIFIAKCYWVGLECILGDECKKNYCSMWIYMCAWHGLVFVHAIYCIIKRLTGCWKWKVFFIYDKLRTKKTEIPLGDGSFEGRLEWIYRSLFLILILCSWI